MKKNIIIMLVIVAAIYAVMWPLASLPPSSLPRPKSELADKITSNRTNPTRNPIPASEPPAASNNQLSNPPSTPGQEAASLDVELSRLIDQIGNRSTPRKSPQNVAALVRQHDDEMRTPLGDVFPNAQLLVNKGSTVIVPLAEYWAMNRDLTSDNYLAATRALRALLSPKKTHELFLRLASQTPDPGRKTCYLNAAKQFAPIPSAEAQQKKDASHLVD